MFSLEKTSFIGVGATVLADKLSLFETSEGKMVFLFSFFLKRNASRTGKDVNMAV